ncbi:hypothetical protein FIBSPDRAFT_1047028 [Athelia psychrophila]|uniref:Hydrophobic surface binding protein n=1 Tax=Athelia psychrophila TaxID=1759441 RepID=A0A166FVW3_9AGAM|nr:hypothetical protein FIBSPDRAFT_1047028 [Fibularhizoctonia sp. CBS 109695]
MVQITSKFLALGIMILGASARSLSKRDVAKVESDIAAISTQVTSLDTAINAFPNTGGSLNAALAINTASGKLVTAINSATKDVNALTPPVAESDADTIFTAVEGFTPTIVHALTNIISKKPSFDALIVADHLVSTDLGSLNSSTVAFEKALVAIAPADLKGNATALITKINAAFVKAIAAYA